MSTFNCPVGAPADVSELEYITALHQTSDADDSDWLDSSIDATDVKIYLMSRHGIGITKDEVRRRIFNGLAGGDGKDECLDITEIMAVLLIPYLLTCVEQERDAADKETPNSCHDQTIQEGAHANGDNPTEQFTDDPTEKFTINSTSLLTTEKKEDIVPERNNQRSFILSTENHRHGTKVIQDVLNIILGDVFGSIELKCLTPQRLRQIFAEYEEVDLITEDSIINEMIDMATGGDPNTLFDVEAFARALTSDVMLYDLTKEISPSSHYKDVFGEKDVNSQEDIKNSDPLSADIEANLNKNEQPTVEITNTFTFPSIDITIDAYRSNFQMILSLILFVRVVYVYGGLSGPKSTVCKSDNFGCTVTNSVLGWLERMSNIMATGTIILICFNLGNNPRRKSIWETIVCFGVITFFYFLILMDEVDFGLMKDRIERQYYMFSVIEGNDLLVWAGLIGFLQLFKLFLFFMEEKWSLYGYFGKVRLFYETYIKTESRLKKACAFKINKLVNNALSLHQHDSSDKKATFAQKLSSANDCSTNALALQNYIRVSEKYESLGGMIWCWKMLWNTSFQEKDGIVLNTRIRVGTVIYVCWILVACLVMSIYTVRFIDWYAEHKNFVDGLYLPSPIFEEIFDILPELWMLQISASFAIMLPLSILIFMAAVSLPSYVITTLKFRTGFLQTLRDPKFKKYRANIYDMAFMLGVLIWSPLISFILVSALVFIIVFIVVWQETRPLVLEIIALVLGVVITILIRLFVVSILKRFTHAAFYRKRPLLNNIATIVLECWTLGITLFSALVRMGKLVLVSVILLGRIDRPVLSDDIGIDNYPLLFRQSILITEAHRHPYIERLGTMYMMKLRYGKRFATQAGSTWRLLFVFALMPWLRKYRIPNTANFDEKEILDLLGNISNTNYVLKLEAENKALRDEIKELKSE